LRIVFCGTGAFGGPSLRALVASGFEVSFVVTRPDPPRRASSKPAASPIRTLAETLGLAIEQPARIGEPAMLARLRTSAPDAIVVVAFGQILRPGVLDLPRLGCLNVHGSLLPRHRGASPIQSAILSGDATTGVTVIRMDAGVDTGPIVLSAPAAIEPRDTFATLHDRLASLGGTLIVPSILGLAAGTIVPSKQDESLATRCRILEKRDGRLDWSQPAAALDRAIRALNPWPGTFGKLERRHGDPIDLAVLEAEPVAVDDGDPRAAARPGRVVRAASGVLRVACGAGALDLVRVRPSGRKALTTGEFLSGYGVAEGDAFEQAPPERASRS
jgi:methionyl-tRNA formyltransferase